MTDLKTLNDIEHKELLKIINGAIKSCISIHGPITKDIISSASKRIIGAIKTHVKNKEEK